MKGKMRTVYYSTVAALGLVIVLGGCTRLLDSRTIRKRLYMQTAEEEYYGVWLSSDATQVDRAVQRFVVHPWGLCEVYHYETDKLPEHLNTYTLAAKWIDQQGNAWYISIDRKDSSSAGTARYFLIRISDLGSTWEEVSDPFEVPLPKDLNPTNPTYGRWHRKL